MNKNIKGWELIVASGLIILFIVAVTFTLSNIKVLSEIVDLEQRIVILTGSQIDTNNVKTKIDTIKFGYHFKTQAKIDTNNILTIYDPNIIVKYDTLNWNNKKPGK